MPPSKVAHTKPAAAAHANTSIYPYSIHVHNANSNANANSTASSDDVTLSYSLASCSHRWLKSHELFAVLSNPDAFSLSLSTSAPTTPPPNGAVFLYNKNTVKRWRHDGHEWITPERHVHLKVNGSACIYALYAHSRNNNLTRRGYWLLSSSDYVLVHYLVENSSRRDRSIIEESLHIPTSVSVKYENPLPSALTTRTVASTTHRVSCNNGTITSSTTNPVAAFASTSLIPPTVTAASLSSSLSCPNIANMTNSTVSSGVMDSSPPLSIMTYSPTKDDMNGGSVLLVVLASPCASKSLFAVFSSGSVSLSQIAPNTFKGVVSALPESMRTSNKVNSSFFLSDGVTRSQCVDFEYYSTQDFTRVPNDLPTNPSFANTVSTNSATLNVPVKAAHKRERSESLHPRSDSLSDIFESDDNANSLLISVDGTKSQNHEYLNAFLSRIQSLPFSNSVFNFSTISALVLDSPIDDLLEAIIMSIFQRAQTRNFLSRDILEGTDSQGRTLLHLASGLGYTHFASLLVQAGTDVNYHDNNGLTALHYAAEHADSNMVSALLSFGANENVRDSKGLNAIKHAEHNRRNSVLAVFRDVERAESNETTWDMAAESFLRTNGPFDWDSCVDMLRDDNNQINASNNNPNSGSSNSNPNDGGQLINRNDSSRLLTIPLSPYIQSPLYLASPANIATSLSLDRAFSALTLADMGVNTTELDDAQLSSNEVYFAEVVLRVQRTIRWWLYRRHFAATRLQAAARGMLVRKSMRRMKESATKIQRLVRERRKKKVVTESSHSLVSYSPTSNSTRNVMQDSPVLSNRFSSLSTTIMNVSSVTSATSTPIPSSMSIPSSPMFPNHPLPSSMFNTNLLNAFVDNMSGTPLQSYNSFSMAVSERLADSLEDYLSNPSQVNYMPFPEELCEYLNVNNESNNGGNVDYNGTRISSSSYLIASPLFGMLSPKSPSFSTPRAVKTEL